MNTQVYFVFCLCGQKAGIDHSVIRCFKINIKKSSYRKN